MTDSLFALIVDEGKWLTASMTLAFIAATTLFFPHHGPARPARRRILAAMNLFFGVTIGTMALGHLLAVTVKLGLDTLEGSVLRFYAIGSALAVPSWLLIRHTRFILASDDHGRATLALNAWVAVTLLALGAPNLPLAAPAILNISYHLHSRAWVGWGIVGLAILVNVGLFIGSLIFMASGQSFEQFRGAA